MSVIVMPLQYALTIRAGFPIKASEILLLGSLIAYIGGRHRRKLASDPATFAVLVLLLTVAFSAIANFTPRSAVDSLYGYDRGLGADLITYAGYAVFALGAWAVFRRLDRGRFARAIVASAWVVGAAVALQFVSAVSGNTSLIALLGFRTVGVDGSVHSLRSGPFLEGQHLGFYAGALLILALKQRRWIPAVICAASIFYSQSTTAYLGLSIGLVVCLLLRPRSKALVPVLGAALLAIIAVLLVAPLRTILGRQLAKLGLTAFAPDYQFATTSLDLRSAKTEIAARMMRDNPVFGVGPGRFGAHFGSYSSGFELPWAYTAGVTRPIAENAYMHVGAELGVIALLALASLLAMMVIRSRAVSASHLILAAYIAIAISTQSSWTFLPIWMFIAFLSLPSPKHGPPTTQYPAAAEEAFDVHQRLRSADCGS